MEASWEKLGGGDAKKGDEEGGKEKSKDGDEDGILKTMEEDDDDEDSTLADGMIGRDEDLLEEEIHSDVCSSSGSVEDLTVDDSDRQQFEELLKGVNGKHRYDWTTYLAKTGCAMVLHPSQMVQTLMQIGYEPFPPRCSVTLLGRPCLLLPSSASYLRYIYQVDGMRGVYRGLVPKIAHLFAFGYVFESARCYIRNKHIWCMVHKQEAKDEGADAVQTGHSNERSVRLDDSEASDSDGIGFLAHFREVSFELGSKLIAVVAAYPLQVVLVRTVAQFVGREFCIRRGFLGEIQAIYSDFGLMGFFRGIVPKLVGETCQTLTVGALAFFVSNQAPGVEIRSLLNLSFSILVSAWTYQFNVVSSTMVVNGSCLKIGQPPLQPIYDNWRQCWRELGRLNLLNRGSSFFCRYYTGPTHVVNGICEPTGMYFGPNLLSLGDLSVIQTNGLHRILDLCLSPLVNSLLYILSFRKTLVFALYYIMVKRYVIR